MKMKIQNKKIVETDMDLWYYTYKKPVIRVRNKKCNISSCKNNLKFFLKGQHMPGIVFFTNFLANFWKYWKNWVAVFHILNICRKLIISVICSSQWNMSLVTTFWVIWRNVMHTCEAPEFWWLHKNINCEVPLSSDQWMSIFTMWLGHMKMNIV